MLTTDIRLNQIFYSTIRPLKIALLETKHVNSPYRILYSSIPTYREGSSKGPYDILPLIRILAKKCQLVSNDIFDDIYKKHLDQFCYVLQWEDSIRRILLFDLKEVQIFEQRKFTQLLQQSTQKLNQIFENNFSQENQDGEV